MQLRMETGINYSTLTALPWLLMLPSVVTAPTYMVEVWVDPDPSAEGLYVSCQRIIWARRASGGSLIGLRLNSSEADLQFGKANGSKVPQTALDHDKMNGK